MIGTHCVQHALGIFLILLHVQQWLPPEGGRVHLDYTHCCVHVAL